MVLDTADRHETPVKESYYTIAPEAIEASGRSVSVVVGRRLCEAALVKLKSPDAWRTLPYRDLRKLLRENCANQEGYLSPRQPVLETALRIILASPQDRLSLSEIHAQVAELWVSSPWPRHISIESLKRVLDNALSYGIARVEGEG